MRIPKKVKKQILVEKDHLSVTEISKKYNLPKNEIKKIIKAAEKKTPAWFYLTLALIPVIILVLLELSLRIFDYGYNSSQWVDAGNGKYMLNPEIGKRYFNNISFNPTTTEDLFDQQKKLNAYRVFVLGGSSSAGYPYMPLGSFSRYIRRRLELTYPNTHIEIVNISMTGVNSYTLLDLIPGVMGQDPDAVLIYTGHNEFYGALGIGSVESLGASRSLVNLILYLNKFKITQLVRNFLGWFATMFSSDNEGKPRGTLMSEMAEDKEIPFNSEKFNKGLEQFRENLRDILYLIREKNVPVMLGKLVSNLKDQKPFISIDKPGNKTADQVYGEAQLEFNNNNISKADSLFRLSKDLDALRFRAPEKINEIIEELCEEFNAERVDIDSLLALESAGGIIGSDLIVDHLHPNLKGYQLIGKAYYDVMEKSDLLPEYEEPEISIDKQDSLTIANFLFTKLDSTIGDYIITLLKNDWPFVKNGRNLSSKYLFTPDNFIDSAALEFIELKVSWMDAHIKVASKYLRKDDIKNYLKHLDVLIYQYPVLKDYNTAVKFFYERNKIDPVDYTAKRIGMISFYSGNYNDAVNYLSEFYRLNPKDTDVLLYLAEAYFRIEEFKKALTAVDQYINIDPANLKAKKLKEKIIASEGNK